MNITRNDLITLYNDNWVNDQIINFYINLIMERSANNRHYLPSVYGMSTFFFKRLGLSGYSGVRKWTKNVDIFFYDLILLPIHTNNNKHWCLAVIDIREKNIQYYNSLEINVQDNTRDLEIIFNYLYNESLDKKNIILNRNEWLLENIYDNPKQNNYNDCGVFCCIYAEYISRGRFNLNFSFKNIPYFRTKMILEIGYGMLLNKI